MKNWQKILIAVLVILIAVILATFIYLIILLQNSRTSKENSIIRTSSAISSSLNQSSSVTSSITSSMTLSSSIPLPTCGGTLVSGGPVIPGTVELVSGNYAVSGYIDGLIEDARFANTIGIALDPVNCILYVADNGNNLIRSINLSANPKIVGTVVGNQVPTLCPSL